MKYVLLFCGDADDAAAFAALTHDELRARYAEVGAWFARLNVACVFVLNFGPYMFRMPL